MLTQKAALIGLAIISVPYLLRGWIGSNAPEPVHPGDEARKTEDQPLIERVTVLLSERNELRPYVYSPLYKYYEISSVLLPVIRRDMRY